MSKKHNYIHSIGHEFQLSNLNYPVLKVYERYHGGFGEVYLLKSKEKDTEFKLAAKTPRKDIDFSSEQFKMFQNEAKLWIEIPPHEHILPAYDIATYNSRPYILIKYVQGPNNLLGPTLADCLEKSNLSIRQVIQTLYSLLKALSHLEENMTNFTHGDIKPSNILLHDIKEHGVLNLYLTDFGLSRSLKSYEINKQTFTGDIYHLPPEVFLGQKSNMYSTDMHCLGVTIFESLFGFPLFYINEFNGQRKYTFNIERITDSSESTGAPNWLLKLIRRLIDPNPAKRPLSFRQLKEEVFMENKGTGIIKEYSHNPYKNNFVNSKGNNSENDIKLDDLLINRGYKIDRVRYLQEELYNITDNINLKKSNIDLKIFEELLDEFRNIGIIYLKKGVVLYLQNDFKGALFMYLKAVDIYNKDIEQKNADILSYFDATLNASQFLCDLNEIECRNKAKKLALSAIEIFPNNVRAIASLGKALIANGEIKNAINILEKGYSIDRKHVLVRLLLAVARSSLSSDIKNEVEIQCEILNLDNNQKKSIYYFLDSLSV
ncbi:MAG: protein kinase family protein [Jejuia sp.]